MPIYPEGFTFGQGPTRLEAIYVDGRQNLTNSDVSPMEHRRLSESELSDLVVREAVVENVDRETAEYSTYGIVGSSLSGLRRASASRRIRDRLRGDDE